MPSGTAEERKPIVDCPGQVLLASDVPLGGLYGCVSQQELDPLQFAARCLATPGRSGVK